MENGTRTHRASPLRGISALYPLNGFVIYRKTVVRDRFLLFFVSLDRKQALQHAPSSLHA